MLRATHHSVTIVSIARVAILVLVIGARLGWQRRHNARHPNITIRHWRRSSSGQPGLTSYHCSRPGLCVQLQRGYSLHRLSDIGGLAEEVSRAVKHALIGLGQTWLRRRLPAIAWHASRFSCYLLSVARLTEVKTKQHNSKYQQYTQITY